jgi:hypothetical protein
VTLGRLDEALARYRAAERLLGLFEDRRGTERAASAIRSLTGRPRVVTSGHNPVS